MTEKAADTDMCNTCSCAFSVVLKCVELNYSVIIVLCAIFVSLLSYNQAKLVLYNEIQAKFADKKAFSSISDWLCLSAGKYYSISVIEISAKCHIGATLVNCNGYMPTLILNTGNVITGYLHTWQKTDYL